MSETIKVVIVANLLAGSVVSAQSPEEIQALSARVARLEKLVETLQQRNEAQTKTIRNQSKELALVKSQSGIANSARDGKMKTSLNERLEIAGLVEVEAGYNRMDSSAASISEADIALATFELGVDANITDWVQASTVLLWEEDDTEPLDIDVASFLLGNFDKFPLYFEAGKLYVPFGNFDSSFITDPVTLELGETRETAVTFGWCKSPVDLNISVYNGEVEEDDDTNNHIESFVVSGTYEHEWETCTLQLGAAYTNNLADSDGLQDAVADNGRGGSLNDHVGGIAGWACLDVGSLNLLVEHIAAVDDFDTGSLSFDGPGNDWAMSAKPKALSFEANYNVIERLALGARYEHCSDVYDWLPENRYGVNVSYLLHESEFGATMLAFEYLYGKYADEDGTSENSIVFQLSAEF